jgi:hypothetical protein
VDFVQNLEQVQLDRLVQPDLKDQPDQPDLKDYKVCKVFKDS